MERAGEANCAEHHYILLYNAVATVRMGETREQ